jgi:hypothetical protein
MSIIAKSLHRFIPKPCHGRPFVCDGLPEDCTVIIIGENPVTEMKADWWSFWDDEAGFDLLRFERDYGTLRQGQGKRTFSNTRLRLNRLRGAGLQCLESNAFWNERADGHGSGSSNEMLNTLIASMPLLKGIIAHGLIAQKCLNGLVLPDCIQRHHMRHFRSESYANLDNVMKQLLISS